MSKQFIIEWMQDRDPSKPYATPRYYSELTLSAITSAPHCATRFPTCAEAEACRQRRWWHPKDRKTSRIVPLSEATG